MHLRAIIRLLLSLEFSFVKKMGEILNTEWGNGPFSIIHKWMPLEELHLVDVVWNEHTPSAIILELLHTTIVLCVFDLFSLFFAILSFSHCIIWLT